MLGLSEFDSGVALLQLAKKNLRLFLEVIKIRKFWQIRRHRSSFVARRPHGQKRLMLEQLESAGGIIPSRGRDATCVAQAMLPAVAVPFKKPRRKQEACERYCQKREDNQHGLKTV